MAKKVQIINTGQTLGKNIVVKEDKIVPPGNADIRPSASPLPAPVLGVVATTPSSVSTENTRQSLQQPKVYFATPSEGITLHRDEFGQTWLSVKATPTITTISLVVFGAISLAMFFKLFHLYQEGQSKLSKLPEGTSSPSLPDITAVKLPVRQVRRLSL